MDSRQIVVDATGHVAGKLAAAVAKKLLEGYSVAVVATENCIFTGPLHRHVGKYKEYKNKRCIVNPARGAFHYKEPSKYFIKLMRNMVPRKTNRGGSALARLTTFEAIPKQFEGVERVMFPEALLSITANPERKFCTLGQILSKFGWKYTDLARDITANLRQREEESEKALAERSSKIQEFTSTPDFKNEVAKIMKSHH